jgi:ABC-type Zn uptake system ZnuABC Zn-binding protein ZnuA
MVPHAGKKFVAYHAMYTYLADRFHLEEVGRMEPKPGLPPTAPHLARLAETMKGARAKAILVAVYNPKDVAENLARETGAKVVTLAHMPGALPGTAGYLEWMDANVTALAAALGGE